LINTDEKFKKKCRIRVKFTNISNKAKSRGGKTLGDSFIHFRSGSQDVFASRTGSAWKMPLRKE